MSFGPGGPDQTPGLIVMQIDDTAGKDMDRKLRKIMVVFNATTVEQTVSGAAGLSLSPLQANGTDVVVKQVTVNGNVVTVPALTVAVLQG